MKNVSLVLLIMAGCGGSAAAQEVAPFRLETGVTFNHFQQQVKGQIGEPRGERIVYQLELGSSLTGTYRVRGPVSVGLFVRFDVGRRTSALFDGFDDEGRTQVRNRVGGNYAEVWMGPLLQFRQGVFMAEFGYAPFGIRNDAGRHDIPSETGDTESLFSIHPAIAWLISTGLNLPISRTADFAAKIEYRPRYYSRRGGRPLAGDIDHGTQSIAPVIGVAWRF